MKLLTLTTSLACIILFSCGDGDKKTTEEKMSNSDSNSNTTSSDVKDAPVQPMDSAAMMKAWMEYMTPSDVHKMIAKSNGTWTEEVTMWMAPDAPPQKNTSTAVNKMILGGRYQESRHTGTFDGMPFEGISTLAYDKARKIFQSSWIDNMGTGIMYLEGPYDSTTRTITLTGKGVDPMTGANMDIRENYIMMDDNNHKLEMFCNKGGKEFKAMEIVLKRK